MTKKNFLTSSLILFVGSMIGNAGAYFFHLYLGRILPPVEYGLLGALLSIYLLISTPLSAIQYTSAKINAVHGHSLSYVKNFYQVFSRYLWRFGLASFGIYLFCSVFFVQYFSLGGYLGVLFLGISLLFLFQLAWNRGIMQGLFDFTELSISYSVEGLVKLFFGIALGYFFLRADYTILSVTISLFIAFLLTVRYARRRFTSISAKSEPLPFTKKEIAIEGARMLIGTVGVAFFISIDVLMANRFLSDYDAGLYTALSTLGKIVYFAPYSVAMALFPFTAQNTDQTTKLNLTRKAYLIIIAIIALSLIFYFACPGLIFGILFGSKYANPGLLLGLIGFSIGIIGIVQLLINYLLSQTGWLYAYALIVSAIVQILLYENYHSNLTQFVSMTLCSAVTMLFLVALAFIGQKNNQV